MECCTGQNEGNHKVTIEYLKSFIGNNVQDSSGAPILISGFDDTYCPTYSELTGGTVIPNFVDGGNGNWSKNVDGISISGTYGEDECVRRENLSLIYTRFESLSIAASPSNISACGGNSTMSYIYTLRKYTESMDGSYTIVTTSTTSVDTSDSGDASIVYTTNPTWASVSKPTVSLQKNYNGTHNNPQRSVVVTGTITFRGTQHSATATITQNALTGDYVYDDSTSYTSSYDSLVVSPWDFGCDGGSWTATGTYTVHSYDIYVWEDICGVKYSSDTDIRNERDTQNTTTVDSGTVDARSCGEYDYDSGHIDVNWNGLSDWYHQVCPACPIVCTCDNFSVNTSTKYISYTSGNYYIPITATCGNVEAEVSSDATSWLTAGTTSTTGVNFSVSSTSSHRSGTITLNFYYNSSYMGCYSAVTVYQEDPPPPPPTHCYCTGVTAFSQTWASSESGSGNAKLIARFPYCIEDTGVTPSVSEFSFYGSSCQVGSDYYWCIYAYPTGSTSSEISRTITVSGNTDDGICSTSTTITQREPVCECTSLYVETAVTLASASSSYDDAEYSGVCGTLSVDIPSSAQTWLGYDKRSSYIRFSAKTANDSTTNDRTTTVTVTETGTDSDPCKREVYVTQEHPIPGCDSCNAIGISVTYTGEGSSSSNPVPAGGGSVTMSYTYNCGDVYVTNDSEINNFTYVGDSVTFTVPSNSQQIATSYTVYFSYSTTGTHCLSKTIYQAAPDPCDGKPCTEMTVTETLHRYLACAGESNVEFATLSYTGNCVTNITASTDAPSWLTATTSNDKVYISASGQSTPSNLRTANVTVSWEVDGQSCSSGLATGQYGCSSSCDCDDLTLTRAPYSATPMSSSSHVGLEIGKFTKESCITSYTVTTNDTWIKDLTVTEYQGYNITANFDENTATTENSGTVTINYTAGTTSCSAITFTVKQDAGSTPPTPCGCDDITRISPTALSYTYNYSAQHSVDYTASCGSISAVTEVGDTIVKTISKSGSHRFNIWVNTNDSYSPRSTNVYFTVDGVKCDDEYVVISQDGKPCNCSNSNFTVSPTSIINISSAGTSSVASSRKISWTADCGSVTAEIAADGSGWLGFHSISGETHRYVTAVTNDTASARTGTVVVSLDDVSNCYSSVTVVQDAGSAPCQCSDLAITSAPYSSSTSPLNSSSYDDEEIGNFSASCAVVTSVTSDVNWISDISYYNSGEIYADISTNTSSTRSGTVTVNYTVNGSSCPDGKTFYVWQAAPSPSCLSAFTITQIESEFCDGTFDTIVKNCSGNVIKPICTYDSSIVSDTSRRITEGMTVVGWEFFVEIDRDKVTPGNTVPTQNVTFTATIDGTQVSSSFTVGNNCCFDYLLANRPIAKPYLEDDVNKNYITIGLSILANGTTPAIIPNSGTASFTYEIEWEPEDSSCPSVAKTTGTFSGGIAHMVTINRPTVMIVGCELYKVKSFTTSLPTGDFIGRNCVSYIYKKYQDS